MNIGKITTFQNMIKTVLHSEPFFFSDKLTSLHTDTNRISLQVPYILIFPTTTTVATLHPWRYVYKRNGKKKKPPRMWFLIIIIRKLNWRQTVAISNRDRRINYSCCCDIEIAMRRSSSRKTIFTRSLHWKHIREHKCCTRCTWIYNPGLARFGVIRACLRNHEYLIFFF